MAGSWGNSVYRAGKVKPGDVEKALGTVKPVGDFEYLSPQHTGRPTRDERRGYAGTGAAIPRSAASTWEGDPGARRLPRHAAPRSAQPRPSSAVLRIPFTKSKKPSSSVRRQSR